MTQADLARPRPRPLLHSSIRRFVPTPQNIDEKQLKRPMNVRRTLFIQ